MGTAHKHLPVTEHPRVQVQSDVFYCLSLGFLQVRQKAGFTGNCIRLNSTKKSEGIRPFLESQLVGREPGGLNEFKTSVGYVQASLSWVV